MSCVTPTVRNVKSLGFSVVIIVYANYIIIINGVVVDKVVIDVFPSDLILYEVVAEHYATVVATKEVAKEER